MNEQIKATPAAPEVEIPVIEDSYQRLFNSAWKTLDLLRQAERDFERVVEEVFGLTTKSH